MGKICPINRGMCAHDTQTGVECAWWNEEAQYCQVYLALGAVIGLRQEIPDAIDAIRELILAEK